jgi:hypothetical protein
VLPRWSRCEEIPRDEYYFAATPCFETAAPSHNWLQQTVAISTGSLVRGGVVHDTFAVK